MSVVAVDGDVTQEFTSQTEINIVVREPKPCAWARLQAIVDGVHSLELCNDVTTLGRGPTSEHLDYNFSSLSHYETRASLSRVHCRIERTLEGVFMVDLSTNGTFVNDVLVGKMRTPLKSGDVIAIGLKAFRVFVFNIIEDDLPREMGEKYLFTSTNLGTGAQGKVVLVKLRNDLTKSFAVKITNIRSRLSVNDEDAMTTIRKEVSIMRKVKHINCIQVVDWYESPRYAFMVMELAQGGELFDRITDEKLNGFGFGEKRGKFYIYQILRAVDYLHRNGITHRDLKPENILCATNDEYTLVKITDFGLSKSCDFSTMRTCCGTPAYMAPEVLECGSAREGCYTTKADIWSMGVVFFTLISGYQPFSERFSSTVSHQIKSGKLVFENQWKYISAKSQRNIKHMLSVNPSKRPTCGELLESEWITRCRYVRYARRFLFKQKMEYKKREELKLKQEPVDTVERRRKSCPM